jgi:uncharacterized iron-regulated protein
VTLALLSSMVACGGGAPVSTAHPASPTGGASAREIQASWQSSFDRDHPLAGRIWDCRHRTYVDADAVWQRAEGARVVLLGEKHDNPDHHRLQAAALAAVVAGARRPAVAFEMFDNDRQAAIDQYRTRASAPASGLGEAAGWAAGWPPFATYLPIFAVAFQDRLPIVAANLPQARAHAIVHAGVSALGSDAARLGLDRPFPAALETSLEDELRASHCGALPDAMLGPMAVAQHARDAQMARSLVDSDKGQGAVLIAGAGHVRLDRGVPYYLRQHDPTPSMLSVAFVEVVRGEDDPRAYAKVFGAADLPFDFVWFTPASSDADPCAELKGPRAPR